MIHMFFLLKTQAPPSAPVSAMQIQSRVTGQKRPRSEVANADSEPSPKSRRVVADLDDGKELSYDTPVVSQTESSGKRGRENQNDGAPPAKKQRLSPKSSTKNKKTKSTDNVSEKSQSSKRKKKGKKKATTNGKKKKSKKKKKKKKKKEEEENEEDAEMTEAPLFNPPVPFDK